MDPDRPKTIAASSGRSFATFPAAVVVPIVSAHEEFLLLESPRRPGWWEPVKGAVDDGETVLDAALREVREEAGPDLRVRPLGVVHASTFAYDARVPHMISVVYLMAHEGGAAVPGDDMRGSRVRWSTLGAIESERLRLLPPFDNAWLRQRTVELFRLWEPEPGVVLQAPLSAVEGSNREILQRLFYGTEGVNVAPFMQAWLAGDTGAVTLEQAAGLAAWEERLDPDFEIDTTGVQMVDVGVLRGPAAWRELWSRWLEDWKHYSWTLSNWREAGEHVIFDTEIRAVGSASGADVTWRHTHVWTVHDGKLIRLALFKDRASALRAIRA